MKSNVDRLLADFDNTFKSHVVSDMNVRSEKKHRFLFIYLFSFGGGGVDGVFNLLSRRRPVQG